MVVVLGDGQLWEIKGPVGAKSGGGRRKVGRVRLRGGINACMGKEFFPLTRQSNRALGQTSQNGGFSNQMCLCIETLDIHHLY